MLDTPPTPVPASVSSQSLLAFSDRKLSADKALGGIETLVTNFYEPNGSDFPVARCRPAQFSPRWLALSSSRLRQTMLGAF